MESTKRNRSGQPRCGDGRIPPPGNGTPIVLHRLTVQWSNWKQNSTICLVRAVAGVTRRGLGAGRVGLGVGFCLVGVGAVGVGFCLVGLGVVVGAGLVLLDAICT